MLSGLQDLLQLSTSCLVPDQLRGLPPVSDKLTLVPDPDPGPSPRPWSQTLVPVPDPGPGGGGVSTLS
jgi:hypothetical protein